MKGWLLDTNVIAELVSPRGDAQVQAWAAAQDEQLLFISILTVAEYDKGIENLAQDDLRRVAFAALRDGIAERFRGHILAVSDPVVRRWGAISGRVKRETGHPPSVVDTLLAATALENDLVLATRNIKDVVFSGALVFNPWTVDPAKIRVG